MQILDPLPAPLNDKAESRTPGASLRPGVQPGTFHTRRNSMKTVDLARVKLHLDQAIDYAAALYCVVQVVADQTGAATGDVLGSVQALGYDLTTPGHLSDGQVQALVTSWQKTAARRSSASS